MAETYTQSILRIRQFLAQAFDKEVFDASEIAQALELTELETRPMLMDMVRRELVLIHYLLGGEPMYKRSGAFVWRKITPIFIGTPEHIVETYEGRLVCWCPSEFDARLIADALKRS